MKKTILTKWQLALLVFLSITAPLVEASCGVGSGIVISGAGCNSCNGDGTPFMCNAGTLMAVQSSNIQNTQITGSTLTFNYWPGGVPKVPVPVQPMSFNASCGSGQTWQQAAPGAGYVNYNCPTKAP